MLKVTELQQFPVPLFGREPGIEIPHRRKQGPQAGLRGPAVCLSLLLTAGDQLKDLRKQGRRAPPAGAVCGGAGFRCPVLGQKAGPEAAGVQRL